ncbi:hypothetical protein D3C81_1859900 [compost metagenome]
MYTDKPGMPLTLRRKSRKTLSIDSRSLRGLRPINILPTLLSRVREVVVATFGSFCTISAAADTSFTMVG